MRPARLWQRRRLDVGASWDGQLGRGLAVQGDPVVTLRRAEVDRTRDVGFFVAGSGAAVDLSDVVVANTGHVEPSGWLGRGVNVQEGAHVTGARLVLRDNREVGLIALGGASLVLEEAHVIATAARFCATTSCSDEPYGYGIVAADGTVALRSFSSRASALCGVLVYETARSI